MNRKCLQCGGAIAGRPDKRFCDYICRNDYHNSLYREETQQTKGVDRVLRRNRKILKAYWYRGLKRVEHAQLEKSGFDFDFFTHLRENEHGRVFRFCFEYGYSFRQDGTVDITIRRPLNL